MMDGVGSLVFSPGLSESCAVMATVKGIKGEDADLFPNQNQFFSAK